MNLLEWSLLILLSVLWGGSFFFVEVALVDLPPFTVVFCRVFFAALTLNMVILLVHRRMPRDPQTWLTFFVMGFLNNAIPFSLIVWGQTHIASGVAAILNATTPLATVVLANFLTADERMARHKAIGVVIGFSGVTIMVGIEFLSGLGAAMIAQLAVLTAAVSYGFAGIYGKRFRGMPPLVTATGQVTASSLLLLPVMLVVEPPWALPFPGPEAGGAVLALAVFSTALAYIVYFRILSTAGATNLLLVTFLIPATALYLGIFFLGEVIRFSHILGLIFIVAGLIAVDGRLLESRRSAPRGGAD